MHLTNNMRSLLSRVQVRCVTNQPQSNILRLPPCPTARDLLRIYNLRAIKDLSQNFLLHRRPILKFIGAAGNLRDSHIVEIGPGPGNITQELLLKRPKTLSVVEIDHRFLPALELLQNAASHGGIEMRIHRANILEFDLSSLFPESASRQWNPSISPASQNSAPAPPNVGDVDPLIKSTSSPLHSPDITRAASSFGIHEHHSQTSFMRPKPSALSLHEHEESIDLPPIHLIGNLPFHVSTPLLLKWMRAISERSSAWRYGRVPFTITLQDKVAERLVAPPIPFAPLAVESDASESAGSEIDARISGKGMSDKRRSRISVMVQNYCHVAFVSTIQGREFTPAPEVNVGVVHCVPRVEPQIADVPFAILERFVRFLFSHRQRAIKYCLAGLFPPSRQELLRELLVESGAPSDSRPICLSIRPHISALAQVYARQMAREPQLLRYDISEPREALEWQRRAVLARHFAATRSADAKTDASSTSAT